ncbi:MAG: hypothetical protein Q8J63_03115 [Candidatus Aquicultor sp.]|nr:hypothetical protein [Candidatus Aquicultor sp.]
MKIKVTLVLLPVIMFTLLLAPIAVYANTETVAGTPPNIGFLEDGKVIVTEPGATTQTTVKPPATSSTKILRDGTVVSSATTVPATTKPTKTATTSSTLKSSSAPVSTTKDAAVTTQGSVAATTSQNDTVVVKGEQVGNPAIASKENLPLTGMDLKPYFAIAILLIIIGRATYTKAIPHA